MGSVTGPHARTPRSHSQWVVGPGSTPQKTNGRGWESARPRTPHTQARGAPPLAPLSCPQRAQSQLARARAVGLVTGPHTHTPRTHSQWVMGSAARPKGRAVVGGRALDPGCPTHRQEAPPPGRAPAAPTARKASLQERALWCAPRGAHNPKRGRGGTEPPPPKKQNKRSTGPRLDKRRCTDRVERPYRRPGPGSREVRAPHRSREGGGRRRVESASTRTRNRHVGKQPASSQQHTTSSSSTQQPAASNQQPVASGQQPTAITSTTHCLPSTVRHFQRQHPATSQQ